jgi:TatD DNase family protein
LYINIHTHQTPVHSRRQIINLYKDFEKTATPGYFSIGLHPWYINAAWENEWAKLKAFSNQKNVIAIGECGLDKVCDVDFKLQQTVFAKQIELANHVGKPLIIHCVKAYDEVLKMLKEEKNAVPAIFHGFNKSKTIADKIIRNGYYISFGIALQKISTSAVIAGIPADRFFLETDDANISIEEIYQMAAMACSIDEASLILQIQKNAAAVFGADKFKQ